MSEGAETFVRNIQNKSLPERTRITQKRVEFSLRNNLVEVSKGTIRYYLSLPGELRDKITYVVNTANNSPSNDAKLSFIKTFFDNCENDKCLNHLDLLNQIQGDGERKILASHLSRFWEIKYIDSILQFKKLFIESFFSQKEPSFDSLKRALNLTLILNLKGEFEKLSDIYTVDIKGRPSLEYYRCKYDLQYRTYKHADDCFSAQGYPLYKLGRMFNKFVHGKKNLINREEFNQIKKKMLRTDSLNEMRYIFLYEILFFSNLKPEDFTKIRSMSYSERNYQGFLLLFLNRRLSFLENPLEKQIERAYMKNFSSTFLGKILRREVPIDSLEFVAKRSLLYQVIKAKKAIEK